MVVLNSRVLAKSWPRSTPSLSLASLLGCPLLHGPARLQVGRSTNQRTQRHQLNSPLGNSLAFQQLGLRAFSAQIKRPYCPLHVEKAAIQNDHVEMASESHIPLFFTIQNLCKQLASTFKHCLLYFFPQGSHS